MIVKIILVTFLVLGLSVTVSGAPISHTTYKSNNTGYHLINDQSSGENSAYGNEGVHSQGDQFNIQDLPPAPRAENDYPNDTAPIPEPITLTLMGLGSLGLGLYRKRQRNSQ